MLTTAIGNPPTGSETVVAIVQRLNDPALVESDLNVVQDHVKQVLFENVVFLWEATALAKEGRLYRNYTENCKALLAGGQLVNESEEAANTYMELLWNMMVKDRHYKKWLQSKQSNKHQALSDQFMSKSIDTRRLLVLPPFACF
jgi:hypothetical protein